MMLVSYSDHLGVAYVYVNEDGVYCVDGFAYFTEYETQKACRIPVSALRMII